MGQENSPINKRSDYWKLFERLGVIIALVASLATVIGLLLQIRSEKRFIELQIVSADQLTRLPSVNGLNGQFTYNNIPVTDLWRLRIQFINSGDATLIGEGAASSLMTRTIPISFPSSVTILNASSETGSFYNLTQSGPNTIEIGFSQWRPGEAFETIIYLSSKSVLTSPPMPTVATRPIIGGDIRMVDLTAKNVRQPQAAIDYLPPPLALVGKILGGMIGLTFGLVAFIWLVIVSPIGYVRAQVWKIKYSDAFQKHLDKLQLPDEEKNGLLKAPWSAQFNSAALLRAVELDEEMGRNSKVRTKREGADVAIRPHPRFHSHQFIWKGFDGPRPPQPSFETFWGTLLAFVIGSILTAACAAILASMLVI